MPDLLPCPFCGGTPYSAQLREHYTTIGCNECQIEFSEHDTADRERCPDALAAWNRRIPRLPAEDVERLKAISLTMESGTPGPPDTGEDYAAECKALRAILAKLEAHRV